jgi:phage shock protein PspC (stress-responsive transcriptional regulator)
MESDVIPGSTEIDRGAGSGMDRVSGLALATASILSAAFMTQHPSLHSAGIAEAIEEIGRKAFATRLVHGALIALMGVIVFGFWGLANRLGLQLATVRLGVVAYSIGTFTMIGAAVVNGFVVPGLAARYAMRPPEDLESVRHLLTLGHEAGQALAAIGVVATSAALLCWSLAMVRRTGTTRVIGGGGALLGAVTVIAIVTGWLRLNVHGMGAVMLTQSIWTIAVAIQLLRRRI